MKKVKKKWKRFILFLQSNQIKGAPLDNILLKLLYGLVILFTVVWMLPTERPFEYSNLTVGSIAGEEIIAPFTFPILKTDNELEKERREGWLSVPPVYEKNTDIMNKQRITLNSFLKDLQSFFKQQQDKIELKESDSEREKQKAKVDSLIRQVQTSYNLELREENLLKFYQLYESRKLEKFRENLVHGLTQVYSQGILDRLKEEIPERKVVVIDKGIENEYGMDSVFDVREASTHAYSLLQEKYSSTDVELELTNFILSVFLHPNLNFNSGLTQERKDKAIHEVAKTRGFVYENQRIIDSHEIVTEDVYRKLQSLADALNKRAAVSGGWKQFKFTVGKYSFALLIILLATFYFGYFRKAIFKNNRILAMITLILFIQFALAALVIKVLNWSEFTVPIILAPMLLAMLLDAGVAFLITIVMSLVLGASLTNDYSFAFISLIVGSIALFSVQRIRNRAQMFRAIFYVMLGYGVVKITIGFLHFETFKQIFSIDVLYMLLNGGVTAAVVFLLIGIFERLFDVTTDITLLELSDLNHPLLKRLSVEAPGTFHHTIIVGNLAEAATKAIGANSLLARVGCYYHDVGKMLKPEYFVENQMDAMNKHESLSPSMSCIILANHVKKGLELAEKYNLPKYVKRFIPEHHGTSIMTYFYEKAKSTTDENELNENDFRYPGPKPQGKETAISMLADTVEAATRTLKNPTPQRIKNFVDTLVDRKIAEGQLEESNLTLREINQIKQAFIPILLGIHHLRIEYPAETAKEKALPQASPEAIPSTNGKNKVEERKDASEGDYKNTAS